MYVVAAYSRLRNSWMQVSSSSSACSARGIKEKSTPAPTTVNNTACSTK